LKREWVIPPKTNAEFVYRMEDVLEIYKRPYDAKFPVACFDETSKQLVSEVTKPIAASPGQTERYDYEYERKGVSNLFMLFEPLKGWRHVKTTDRRTKRDFAQCMKDIVDVHYPTAEKITVVLDNLNTHFPASLYHAFEPAEARRILNRLDLRHTPKHGSWLNMAEIELSILSKQCLDRRIPEIKTLRSEIATWEKKRNRQVAKMNWQFKTEDARIKLRKLYPSTEG
jgi:DDE superfamily endonuclease